MDPKSALIKGAAWSLATRWSTRIIGFVNTVVMARLVMPSDYGVVAMAFLVVGLLQALLDFSVTTALLRKETVSNDEVESAWTLRGIQGLIMAGIMVLTVPLTNAYFRDEHIATILYVFAVCVGISGFGNIGLTLAQKRFDFALEFRLQLYAKTFSVFMTIAAGYWLRDFRALVVGISSGYLSGFVLSYLMHPYRPRWNTSEIVAIWRITGWLMVANVGGFVLRKGDEFVAARIGAASDFGLYNVGADLGQMPTGEVGPAVLKSFLPVLASMKGSIHEINAAVIKTLRVVAALTFSMGFGLAAVADSATHLILGAAWTGAVPFVAAFSILGIVQVIGGPVTTLLTLRGHTRALSHAVWIEFATFLLCAIFLVPVWGLIGLVFSRIAGALVNLTVILTLGRQACGLPFLAALASFARPLVGSLLMYGAVLPSQALPWDDGLRLLTGIVVGAAVYIAWSLVTWLLANRPEGIESMAFDFLRNYRK